MHLLETGKVALLLCLECFGMGSEPGKELRFLKELRMESKKCALQLCLEKVVNLCRRQAKITVLLVVDHRFMHSVQEWLQQHHFNHCTIILKEYVMSSRFRNRQFPS
jgi:hypothetical protein